MYICMTSVVLQLHYTLNKFSHIDVVYGKCNTIKFIDKVSFGLHHGLSMKKRIKIHASIGTSTCVLLSTRQALNFY